MLEHGIDLPSCYCCSFDGSLDTKPDIVAMGLLSLFSAIALVQLPASLFYVATEVVWKIIEKSSMQPDILDAAGYSRNSDQPIMLSQSILIPNVLSELVALFEHDIYDASRYDSYEGELIVLRLNQGVSWVYLMS